MTQYSPGLRLGMWGTLMSQVILEALRAFFYSSAHTFPCVAHATLYNIQTFKYLSSLLSIKKCGQGSWACAISFIGAVAVRPDPQVSCLSPFSLPNIKTHAESQLQNHNTTHLTCISPDEKYRIWGYEVTCSSSLSPAHYQFPFNQAVDSLLCTSYN